jgi:hypothetical protein
MKHLLEDITSSVSGQEKPAQNEDRLTAEEKAQLRELCLLMVISEFLEKNTGEPELNTARPQRPEK